MRLVHSWYREYTSGTSFPSLSPCRFSPSQQFISDTSIVEFALLNPGNSSLRHFSPRDVTENTEGHITLALRIAERIVGVGVPNTRGSAQECHRISSASPVEHIRSSCPLPVRLCM